MSLIGKNIKKIRTIKKLSQADFAARFNLARASIGAYEEGRAEPKIDNVIQIASEFRISIDALLTRELTINDIFHFDDIHKELLERPRTDWQLKKRRIPFVSAEHQLEYSLKYNKNDFNDQLPHFIIPQLEDGKHKAFEVITSDMEFENQGIKKGDIAIGKKLDIQRLTTKETENPVVLVTNRNVLIRKVSPTTESQLKAESFNPKIKDETIDPVDVLESWMVIALLTFDIRPPQPVELRFSELEKRMAQLEQVIRKNQD
jgi:transcriptional regulator with XRE-family HTH domain